MPEPFDPYRKWLGIPPKDQPPNHYRLLAVELFEDDSDIISNAADRLMAHVRTFQTGPHSPESQKLLNELAGARHSLLDPAKKAAYDQQLRDRLLGAKPVIPQAPVLPAAHPPAAPVAAPLLAPAPIGAPSLAPRPYPQPVQPLPAAMPPQPAAPYVPAISTRSIVRRKAAWQTPAAVVVVAATLLVSGYYLLQLRNQGFRLRARTPAGNATSSQAAPESAAPERSGAAIATELARRRLDRAARPPQKNSSDQGGSSQAIAATNKPARANPTLDLNSLVGKMAVGSVDLLGLIDPERDSVKDKWRFEDGRLISPEGAAARLAVPYRLPPEYMLTVVLERKQGDDAFSVGFMAGYAKAAATVDGWHGAVSGLQLVDGRSAEGNATTRLGRALVDGGPNTLVYSVTKHGIVVTANGASIVDFSGDFQRLSWPKDWEPPVPERLELIGSPGSQFAISKLELTAISDPAKVAGPVRPSAGQSTPSERTAPRGSAPRHDRLTLGALLNGPETKLPVPDQKDLAKAERQARDLYGDSLTNAKQLEQKQALAFTLFDKASENQADAAAQYVLLRMARDAGAEGGSAKIVVAAVDEMAKWYQVDARELKLEAIAKAGKTAATPQLKQELVDAALSLADECVSADEYDQAAKSAGIALSAARALKDLRRMKEIADKKRAIDRIEKARAVVSDDFARLAADESDPEANLAAGKFYCFVKQQWDEGLAHLARGADPALKELAERDLAKPGSTEDQKALADDWREYAGTEKGPAGAAILNRAAFWYRRALQFLSGLEKETVEKRLGELDADAPAAGAETKYLADLPEANVLVERNSFYKGRTDNRDELKVDGKLSPKGLFAPPASKGFSSVAYLVNKKALTFIADVGLAEWPSPSRTPLTFELWGDGGLLWRSKQIAGQQDTDHCEAFIGKVQTLELRVLCPGSNLGAKAVWIEPRVKLK